MISDEFDYEQIRLKETYGIKQYKDSLYRGELNIDTRKREGFGVIVYNTGRVYEGQWLLDKRHFKGYELYQNGNSYQGEYQHGKPTGMGLYTWLNGETYHG